MWHTSCYGLLVLVGESKYRGFRKQEVENGVCAHGLEQPKPKPIPPFIGLDTGLIVDREAKLLRLQENT